MNIKKMIAIAGLTAATVFPCVKSAKGEARDKMRPEEQTSSHYFVDGIPTTKEGYFSANEIRDSLQKIPVSKLKEFLTSAQHTETSRRDLAKIVSNGNKSVEESCSALLDTYEGSKNRPDINCMLLMYAMLGLPIWGSMAMGRKALISKTLVASTVLAACVAGYKIAFPTKIADITDKEMEDTITKGYEVAYRQYSRIGGIPNNSVVASNHDLSQRITTALKEAELIRN